MKTRRPLIATGIATIALGFAAGAYAQEDAEERANPPAQEETMGTHETMGTDEAEAPSATDDEATMGTMEPEPADQAQPPASDPRSDDAATGAMERKPADEGERAASEPEKAAGDSRSEYVVKEGDTLSEIAKEVTGDAGNWNEIAKENGIDDPTKLQVGKRLRIPESLTSA